MFDNWWSTVKEVSGGIANKYRRPRCDDDGYPQVRIIGSVALNPESLSTSQANYVATTGGTGYSIGDQITATMWWDTSTPANPAFLVAAFYNWETSLEISPSMAHLEQIGGDALTYTQMQSLGLATQATLAAVLAKIIAAPATESTLADILAKIIAAPATEATQTLSTVTVQTIAVTASSTTTAAIINSCYAII